MLPLPSQRAFCKAPSPPPRNQGPHGLSAVGTEEVSVSVKEIYSVTLHTDVETIQQDDIKWYFNDVRIAQVSGDLSFICTDVQCNEGTERFRDRLKLDHQTGSLTITNTNTTDSGVYKLQIISSNIRENTYNVTIYGVSDAELEVVKINSTKEGESITIDPAVIKNPNDVMEWYFNDLLIAETTGDQSKICTHEWCKERFRDRLHLDHQTGSLTITNTRTADSGLYELQMNTSITTHQCPISIRSIRRFSVTVISKYNFGALSHKNKQTKKCN
ncbi:uncharacterized protein [Garra rufa]|uniref:uncharacterized protein n=1 Tax=Garra rufa TaxID=137080 RepID=UPI003CCE6645